MRKITFRNVMCVIPMVGDSIGDGGLAIAGSLFNVGPYMGTNLPTRICFRWARAWALNCPHGFVLEWTPLVIKTGVRNGQPDFLWIYEKSFGNQAR